MNLFLQVCRLNVHRVGARHLSVYAMNGFPAYALHLHGPGHLPALCSNHNHKVQYSSIIIKRTLFTRNRLPFNSVIVFVPQQEAWIIERFGKFSRILSPGLNFCWPFIERIAYVQSLKEIPIEIPDQPAITVDNVTLNLNGILFVRVADPYQASYGIEDAEFAMTQLAQTTMRSELGKIPLDAVFRERDSLNKAIVIAINEASLPWGITCLRYEIRDIILPQKIKDAMQMQVEADRKKRAAILESEGIRSSDINVAEGKRRSAILASEAVQMELSNRALGESEAILKVAEARSKSIEMIALALGKERGTDVISFAVAEKYIEAFGNLAKKSNTVLLPAQTGDISSMAAQALGIYNAIQKSQHLQSNEQQSSATKMVKEIERDLSKYSTHLPYPDKKPTD